MDTKWIINKAKNVNKDAKAIINGYIRHHQNQQNIINIPLYINYVIIVFYCITDQFTLSENNEYKLNNKLNLTNNGKKINITQNAIYKIIPDENTDKIWADYAFIYCKSDTIQSTDLSIGKYQWSFAFKDGPHNAISFGIISTPPHVQKWWKISGIKYHKIFSHGIISNHHATLHQTITCPDLTNGIIHLELDMNKRTLSFTTHKSQKGYIISNNVDISNTNFCFAVAIPILTTNEIEMIEFKTKQNYIPHAFRDIMNYFPRNYQFGFELPAETSLKQDWSTILSKQYIKH